MNTKRRRKIWFGVLLFMLGPGALINYIFLDSVALVNIQSWLALVISAAAGWAAETPVEVEGASPAERTSSS